MRIGFIGLGNMGAPMAENLAKAGHEVVGFDPASDGPDRITRAETALDAVKGAEIVITMLPNGQILRNVAAQILPEMTAGAVLCDCSTVDVESVRVVADNAQSRGIGFIDAPVSGGVGGASGGTLTFMVGGSADTFAQVSPLFEIMGQKSVLCGEAGAGQAAKMCNNMILGATMAVTCEAFALADKLGLDRARMFDVVSTSTGASWSINSYCPAPNVGPKSPADNDYKPGFSAALMLKDLRLAQSAAEAADAATPLGKLVMELYAEMVEQDHKGDRDFSALLPWISGKTRSGVKTVG